MSTETYIAGQEHYDRAAALLSGAHVIPPGCCMPDPSAESVIAEAQVHVSMAIYEALTDIAAELSIIRKQSEPS